jgi:undecaprenyl-diphosphatase
MNEIIIQIFLGVIQGVTEWLPVSSSGIVTLINANLLGISDIGTLVHQALLLHLGTFFAALIYFRKDVIHLTKSLFRYKSSDKETKNVLNFLIISTIISGILGLILLKTLISFENQLQITAKTITLFIGLFLLITGYIQIIQIKTKKTGLKKEKDIQHKDSILLGVTQGVSSLPGISRSGITVSTLLLRKFDDTTALKLSFLMSLPIVLAGNILLNLQDFTKVANLTSLYGLLFSFIFGILTIHGMIKLSKKINFGWFALIFAIITLMSLFLI